VLPMARKVHEAQVDEPHPWSLIRLRTSCVVMAHPLFFRGCLMQ
jgi:hypothetical protein